MTRAVGAILALLLSVAATACGATTPRSDLEERGDHAVDLADALLAAARAHAHPDPGAGWSGGWGTCVSYTDHQVELAVSGSFGGRALGAESKQAVLAAVRAAGWQVKVVRQDAHTLSFAASGDGVSGTMSVSDTAVVIDAGTGCLTVSEDDSDALVARPALHSR